MTQYHRVLLDTSAVVAVMQPNEQHHERCVASLRQIHAPLLTTWAVLTEVDYLLRSDAEARSKLLQLIASPAVTIVELGETFIAWYSKFLLTYHDQEVQIADASLVWLAETIGTETIFTLDNRDFRRYRIRKGHGESVFNILPELT